MAGVSFTLDAETKRYLNKLSQAQSQSQKSLNAIDKRFGKTAKVVDESMKSMDKGLQSLISGFGAAGLGVAVAVGVKAINAITSTIVTAGSESAKTKAELDKLARSVGMNVGDFNKLASVVEAAGVNMDEFTESLNEASKNIESGTGLDAYFDSIAGKITRSRAELMAMGKMDQLRTIVSDLEAAGVSGKQAESIVNSLGAGLGKVIPQLKMQNSEIETVFNTLSTKRVLISDSTAQLSKSLEDAGKLANDNFKTYIAETFKGTIKGLNDVANAAARMASRMAYHAKGSNWKDDITARNIKFGSGDDARDFLERANRGDFKYTVTAADQSAYSGGAMGMQGMNTGGMSNYPTSGSGNNGADLKKAKEDHDAYVAQMKWEAMQMVAISDASNAAIIGSDAKRQRTQRDAEAENNKLIRDQIKASNDNIIQLENAKNNALTDEERDAYAAKISEQKKSLDTLENNLKFSNDSIAEMDKSAADKLKSEKEKLRNEELAAEKAKLDAQKRILDDSLDSRITLEKMRAEEARKQLKNDLDARLITTAQYHAALIMMERESAKRIREIEEENAKARLANVRFFSANKMDQLVLDRRMEIEEVRRRGEEAGYTESEIDEKIADVRREYREREIEEQTKNFVDDLERRHAQAQLRLEWLRTELESNRITQDEYNMKSLEQTQIIKDTELEIWQRNADAMAGIFGNMGKMFKDGSKAQKAALIAQKAATMSSIIMNGILAWSNVDKQPEANFSVISAAAQKKIVMAQYAMQVGALAATSISGAAHGGMDNIPAESTWLLEKGERVLSPNQNRDLTSFLDNNKARGGTTTVNADLVINGGASMSDAEWTNRLFQFREQITQATMMARQENPMLG